MMTKTKAVLFDHDDTLVGTIASKWAEHKHVARTHYGRELTDEMLRQHWGKPFREMITLLLDLKDVDAAMEHYARLGDTYPKELFTASIPTLRRLKAAGLKLGIITATYRDSFERDLRFHGVPRSLIDYTQTSDDTPYHKPDPRVFEPAVAWLDRHGIEPAQVVYVGDGLHDMRAALGAGFNFIGVTTGLVTAAEFHAAGADTIATLDEFMQEHTDEPA